jgi:GT2 family glycosyltransferase
MKNLIDLYSIHVGKVSDKLALCLDQYQSLLSPYEEQSISILEIGIHNRGFLEVWSRYFPNAKKIVVCDQNLEEIKLIYEDPRKVAILGDPAAPDIRAEVLDHSDDFDIVIQDISNTSGDFIRVFTSYFSLLKEGGVFLMANLHSTYLQERNDQISPNYSYLTFLKHLADIVNYKQSAIDKSRSELISDFKEIFEIEFFESALSKISSIEFTNFLCVIRKKNNFNKDLDLLKAHGKNLEEELGGARISSTSSNMPRSNSSPSEIYNKLLSRESINNQQEVEWLQRDNKDKQNTINQLTQEINALYGSRSWRYSVPFRIFTQLIRQNQYIFSQISHIARLNNGYVGLAIKIIKIMRSEGLQGIAIRVGRLISATSLIGFKRKKIKENDYKKWIHLYENLDSRAIDNIKKEIAGFSYFPKISVVMPVYNAPLNFLKEAIESVQSQIYPYWELCIADDCSSNNKIKPMLEAFARSDKRIKVIYRTVNGHISAASNSALEIASGDFVALLDQDDLISKNALFEIAKLINQNKNVKFIYSDEDKINELGERCEPFFKPDWSPHLAISQAYIGHLVVFDIRNSKPFFDEDINGAQDYDLWLSLLAKINRDEVFHLPKILYHWRKHHESTAGNPHSKSYADDAGLIAVTKYLSSRYPQTNLTVAKRRDLFTYRISSSSKNKPKASIIIPTKDAVQLLKACIDSIKEKTLDVDFEILIINNNSCNKETIDYFNRIVKKFQHVKVIDAPIEFNWSKLNNIGVKHATGDFYVFLNNDTEVISKDWLSSMVTYAALPDVGVVGGLLLFEDGSIQHSGVVVGMGGWADHVYRTDFLKHSSAEGFISPALTRNVLAVTGACMVISKDKFLKIGKFDEEFIVCGSDVEICVRAFKLGYYNVMCAEALLYHFESKTRTSYVPENDFEQSRKKYEPFRTITCDPFYNHNLSLERTKPSLKKVGVM